MRIIHCLREPVGGLFRHVCDLSRQQAEMGHEVGILCDANTGGDRAEAQLLEMMPYLKLGFTRLPIPRNPSLHDLNPIFQAASFFNGLRPNIIHGHGAKGGLYARLYRLFPKKGNSPKIFYTPHGGSLHFETKSLKGRVFFTVERMLEGLGDGLLFVCDFEKNAYSDKIGAPKKPWKVVHNGLNESEFSPVRLKKDAADFLYVGAMRDLKGPDLLIRAFTKARLQTPEITLAMVGDGPDKAKYLNMVKLLKISDRVTFHNEMPARDAFKLGQCVVIPSRHESFPYIILEALAATKPLIATNVGGVHEIFGSFSSKLCAPDSEDALTDKLLDFKKNRANYSDLSKKMNVEVEEKFSSARMASAITNFYENLN